MIIITLKCLKKDYDVSKSVLKTKWTSIFFYIGHCDEILNEDEEKWRKNFFSRQNIKLVVSGGE